MDPVETIVLALALGAIEGVKSTAEQAVKDAYNSLKNILMKKNVSVEVLEKDPNSPGRKSVIKEELASSDALNDPEILKKAEELLNALKEHLPHSSVPSGFDMTDVEIGILEIKRLRVNQGRAFEIKRGKINGVHISDMEMGSEQGNDNSPKV